MWEDNDAKLTIQKFFVWFYKFRTNIERSDYGYLVVRGLEFSDECEELTDMLLLMSFNRKAVDFE